MRVPAWMWIRTGRNRAIARDAFADLLPADILHRTSKGTYVTLAGALYARNRSEMLRFLETGHLNARQLLDMPVLRRAIASNTPPKDTSFFRIFDLSMIENRSEEHTSELQSLMRISYAVFCLKKKQQHTV